MTPELRTLLAVRKDLFQEASDLRALGMPDDDICKEIDALNREIIDLRTATKGE